MPNQLLTNKTALITGVSRKAGIGAAIAHEFANAGANVFTTYFRPADEGMPWKGDPAEAETIFLNLRKLGVKADGIELDLGDPAAVPRLFDEAEKWFGGIDIVVNNAAHWEVAEIDMLTPEMLDRHYAVNIRAMMLICSEFVKRFQKKQGGRIINLTSGQSLHPMPGELAYAASKGAVEAFTKSLAAELAPRGITVNALDPGPTDTGWMSPDFKTELEKTAPMRRVGFPDDAARLVRILASDEAAWVTGQVLHSRGGL